MNSVSTISGVVKTELCDEHGRVIRPLHVVKNMTTDWGMNQWPFAELRYLIDYLHIGNMQEPIKRVLSGSQYVTVSLGENGKTLTLDCNAAFFESADVGRAAKIANWPEVKITGYTSPYRVTAEPRWGEWPPGFTPPQNYQTQNFGVHYTDSSTLANEIACFYDKDWNDPENDVCLNDSANSRWIYKKVWLSQPVEDLDGWTVYQLGWGPRSDDINKNVFGKVTFTDRPDRVPHGKRYKVTFQLYVGYTPINLQNQELDFGELGRYYCDIRTERIGNDYTAWTTIAFLRPSLSPYGGNTIAFQDAVPLQTTLWEGDIGYDNFPGYYNNVVDCTPLEGPISDEYTTGTHLIRRTIVWSDMSQIESANSLAIAPGLPPYNYLCGLRIKFPNDTYLHKPYGYKIAMTWKIFMQRQLIN
jgi:hypothetical protein